MKSWINFAVAHFALGVVLGLFLFDLTPPADASNCVGYSRTYSAPSYSQGYAYTATKVYKAPTAYKEVAYEEPVYYKFQAFVPLIQIPTYSAVYAPPVAPFSGVQQHSLNQDPAKQQQAQGELQQVLKGLTEVTTTLRNFDDRLRRLEERSGLQAPPPQPQALPKEQPKQQGQAPKGNLSFATVNAKACAMCHERGKESFGGDFILSETSGAMVKLTDAQAGAMSRVLLKGKMPKLNARAKEHGITGPLTAEEAQAILSEVDAQLSK